MTVKHLIFTSKLPFRALSAQLARFLDPVERQYVNEVGSSRRIRVVIASAMTGIPHDGEAGEDDRGWPASQTIHGAKRQQ